MKNGYLYRAQINLVIQADGLDIAARAFRDIGKQLEEMSAVISASTSLTDLQHAPDLDKSLAREKRHEA